MKRILAWALPLAIAACTASPPVIVSVPTPAPTPQRECHAPAQRLVDAELLFGLPVDGPDQVGAATFDAFVAAQITPRFPDGLTVLAGDGQYRPPGGRIGREKSRMVLIVAADTPATTTSLEQIRTAYRMRFHQRSVGLILITSCASF